MNTLFNTGMYCIRNGSMGDWVNVNAFYFSTFILAYVFSY